MTIFILRFCSVCFYLGALSSIGLLLNMLEQGNATLLGSAYFIGAAVGSLSMGALLWLAGDFAVWIGTNEPLH